MLSPADMLILGAAALLFFGPDQLPKVARRAGHVMRDIQSTSQSFIREMERAADDAEFRETAARMDPVPHVAEPGAGYAPETAAVDAEAAVARSAAVVVDSDPALAHAEPAEAHAESPAVHVESPAVHAESAVAHAEASAGAPLSGPVEETVPPAGGAPKPGSEV